VRRYTYPPDFNYIDARQLDSAMWRMADQVRSLDAALRDVSMPDGKRQKAIVEALDGIAAAGRMLGSDHRTSNHPVLDEHLPQLLDDVAMARDAAADTPPRYALAGAVAGACVYCHLPRVATTASRSS